MKIVVYTVGLLVALVSTSAAVSDAPTSLSGEFTMSVAASHPLAVEAGMSMLEQGGNAIDATLAVAFALNVVEPAASGIGGGGFMLFRSARTKETVYYDYRETAPAALTRDTMMVDGKLSGTVFRSGGLAVGVPGMVRGLLLAHREHGTLPLDQILEPAIRYAREGFVIGELMTILVQDNLEKLADNQAAADVYLEDGLFPYPVGTLLIQEDLATTLESIRDHGEDAIYGPEMAEKIATAIRDAGGVMTADDIISFRVTKRQPLRGNYRGYSIYTAPPPSSGGIQVLQALSVLNGIDLTSVDPDSSHYNAILVTILNQTAADSNTHAADPAFYNIPMDELMSPQWTRRVSALLPYLETEHTANPFLIPNTAEEPGNTTHMSIIDKDGNVVSLTQTINSFFGSGVMIPGTGILMNNEMYDFTVSDGAANFPEPGKKPRSSMTPTILIGDDGELAAIGTPGGLRIPSALLQILLRRIDHGQTLEQAIDAPRLYVDPARKRVSFEEPLPAEAVREALTKLADPEGWTYQQRNAHDPFFGGAHAIWREDGIMEVSADPRRDGAVGAE